MAPKTAESISPISRSAPIGSICRIPELPQFHQVTEHVPDVLVGLPLISDHLEHSALITRVDDDACFFFPTFTQAGPCASVSHPRATVIRLLACSQSTSLMRIFGCTLRSADNMAAPACKRMCDCQARDAREGTSCAIITLPAARSVASRLSADSSLTTDSFTFYI